MEMITGISAFVLFLLSMSYSVYKPSKLFFVKLGRVKVHMFAAIALCFVAGVHTLSALLSGERLSLSWGMAALVSLLSCTVTGFLLLVLKKKANLKRFHILLSIITTGLLLIHILRSFLIL